MLRSFRRFAPFLLLSLAYSWGEPFIGQSAVITLAMPWGARAAGMGETFTAIADDESAIFYNPAGLGQAPLTKKWIHYPIEGTQKAPLIKKLTAHTDKKELWALTESNDIYSYNGGQWINYTLHMVDSGQTIEDIARIFLPGADEATLKRAATIIRDNNDLFKTEKKRIAKLLSKSGLADKQADSLSYFLTTRPDYEHNRTDIYAYLLSSLSDEKASEVADEIAQIFDYAPPLWGQVYSLKIPYTIAITSTVHDLAIDGNGRLWLATDKGLWRYSFEWTQFGLEEGLKSDTINSLHVSKDERLLVGTQKGAYVFTDGLLAPLSDSLNETPIYHILQTTPTESYVGTERGLFQISTRGMVAIDTSNGLIANRVQSLFIDSRGGLWVGATGGVSYYNGKKWARFKFPGSTVSAIAEEDENHLWFATENGAVEYLYNEAKDIAEWKVHHEKNTLPTNKIQDIIHHRFDTWVATDKGLSLYQHGGIRANLYFENLLPSLHLDDMWHAAMAGIIPLKEYGTLGVSVEQIYFGDIPNFNADGTGTLDTTTAFEIVAGLTYGLPISDFSSVGLTAKYFHSKLDDSSKVNSVAFDVGILRTKAFGRNLNFGFTFLNFGPPVAYNDPNRKDPIPFTLRGGIAGSPVDLGTFKINLALDLDREVVYVDENGDGTPANAFEAIWKDLFDDPREEAEDELAKIIVHMGSEFLFRDFLAGRVGYLHDKAGARYEINLGLGVHAGRVLGDFGIILALGDQAVRHNQIRFGVTYAQ